jgi:hypothetical protein
LENDPFFIDYYRNMAQLHAPGGKSQAYNKKINPLDCLISMFGTGKCAGKERFN